MNKKIICSVIIISLFCLTQIAFGQSVTLTNPLGETNTFAKLLDNIITGVAGVVASLATIMIIIAGILYLTSAGSPERINTAKKALIYAIVGIVIALSAGAIAIVIKTAIGVPPTP